MKVRWKPAALRDVAAHAAYIEQFNRIAANELAVSLFTAGDSLSSLPHRGRPGRIPGTRELLSVPPYVLVYEVDRASGTVMIQRVWHGKLLT